MRRRDGFVFEDTLTCSMEGLGDVVVVGGLSKGLDVRDVFCKYFNGPGAVTWQKNRVF